MISCLIVLRLVWLAGKRKICPWRVGLRLPRQFLIRFLAMLCRQLVSQFPCVIRLIEKSEIFSGVLRME
ncbi:hypothetical protein LINPERHAP1_LOCUS13737 [Linum perenne]